MSLHVFWVPHHISFWAFLHKRVKEKAEAFMIFSNLMISVKMGPLLARCGHYKSFSAVCHPAHILEVYSASQTSVLYINAAFNFHSTPAMLEDRYVPKNFLLKPGCGEPKRRSPLRHWYTMLPAIYWKFASITIYMIMWKKLSTWSQLVSEVPLEKHYDSGIVLKTDREEAGLALQCWRKSSGLICMRKLALTSVASFWNREYSFHLTKASTIHIKQTKIKQPVFILLKVHSTYHFH